MDTNHRMKHYIVYRRMAPQQNLWVAIGSDESPSAWYNAIFNIPYDRNPNGFLVTTFALLLNPSTQSRAMVLLPEIS